MRLVSLQGATVRGEELHLDHDKATVRGAPAFYRAPKELSSRAEAALSAYYASTRDDYSPTPRRRVVRT